MALSAFDASDQGIYSIHRFSEDLIHSIFFKQKRLVSSKHYNVGKNPNEPLDTKHSSSS